MGSADFLDVGVEILCPSSLGVELSHRPIDRLDRLGELYAGFGGGPTEWRRAICAQE